MGGNGGLLGGGKQGSLSQLGGGGLDQVAYDQWRSMPNQPRAYIPYTTSPTAVVDKPKSHGFAEAMVGNIKRKFREDL